MEKRKQVVIIELGRKPRGPEYFYGSGGNDVDGRMQFVGIRYEIIQYLTINRIECVIGYEEEQGYVCLEYSKARAIAFSNSEEEILEFVIDKLTNSVYSLQEVVNRTPGVSQDTLRELYKSSNKRVDIKREVRKGFFS